MVQSGFDRRRMGVLASSTCGAPASPPHPSTAPMTRACRCHAALCSEIATVQLPLHSPLFPFNNKRRSGGLFVFLNLCPRVQSFRAPNRLSRKTATQSSEHDFFWSVSAPSGCHRSCAAVLFIRDTALPGVSSLTLGPFPLHQPITKCNTIFSASEKQKI